MKTTRIDGRPSGAYLVVLAGLALFALVGCGGGSSSASTSTHQGSAGRPKITKAQLIKKGDAICLKTDEIQQAGVEKFEKQYPGRAQTPAGFEAAIAGALTPIGREIEQLISLGAPRGDAAKLSVIWKGFDSALEAAERNPRITLKAGGGPFKAPDELASQYGFIACASPL